MCSLFQYSVVSNELNGVKVCMRCGDALFSVDGYREDLVESQGASQGLPRWLSGEEPTCRCRRCEFDPWVRKIVWRRKW